MNCEIDVWLIDLPEGAELAGRDIALLSPAEQARLRGYQAPRAALEFALTRIALRRILGDRLGLPPARVALATADGGKPFIDGAPRCRFNVTHAGSLAAIAVHDSIEVGIDVEHRSSLGDPEALSAYICSPAELDGWRAAGGPTPSVDLLARLWTGKEALLKAVGHGLAIRPNLVDLSASAAAGCGRVALPDRFAPVPGEALRWQALALGAGWHGAIAALVPAECDGLVPRHRTLPHAA